jgi:hypothetical protein
MPNLCGSVRRKKSHFGAYNKLWLDGETAGFTARTELRRVWDEPDISPEGRGQQGDL